MRKTTKISQNHVTIPAEAFTRLQQVTTLIEEATGNALSIIGIIQDLVASLPDNSQKQQLTALVRQLYESCTFEDLASQHISQVTTTLRRLQSGEEPPANTLLNGPALSDDDSVSQNDIDRLLKE